MTPDLARYILARLEQEPRTILTGAHLVEVVNRTLQPKLWIGVDGTRPLVARTGCTSLQELRRALRALSDVGMVTSQQWVPMRRTTGRGVYEVQVELDWRRWSWSTARTLDLPASITSLQRGETSGADLVTQLVEALVRHHERHDVAYAHARAEEWAESLEAVVGRVVDGEAPSVLAWAFSHDPWITLLRQADAGDILARNWTYLSTQATLATLRETP